MARGIQAPERQRAPEKAPKPAPKIEISPVQHAYDNEVSSDATAGVEEPQKARGILEMIRSKKIAGEKYFSKTKGIFASKAGKESKAKVNRKSGEALDKAGREWEEEKQKFNNDVEQRKESVDPVEKATGYDLDIHTREDEVVTSKYLIAEDEKKLNNPALNEEQRKAFQEGIDKAKAKVSEDEKGIQVLKEERKSIKDKDGDALPDQVIEFAKGLGKPGEIVNIEEAQKKLSDADLPEDQRKALQEGIRTAKKLFDDPLGFIEDKLEGYSPEQKEEMALQAYEQATKSYEMKKTTKAGLLALLVAAFSVYHAGKSASKQSGQGHGGMI